MVDRTCSNEGCDRKHYGQGLCHSHYMLAKKRGLLDGQAPCTVDGCEGKVFARGWCHKHWERWNKHGSLELPVRPKVEPKPKPPCSVDGCDRPVKGRGYCALHLVRVKKTGEPGPVTLLRVRADGCAVEGCDRPHGSAGYCSMHWQRFHKYGDPLVRKFERGDAFTRFIDKVDVTAPGGCWLWTGHRIPVPSGWDKGTRGYGVFSVASKPVPAHRWSYEFFVGPIPAGFEPDHLCNNKGCVNPDHLEPVTRSVNLKRAYAYKKVREARAEPA